MGYLKLNGIVIREVNTGDADKIITLFTDKKGKVSVFLRNARRMKNKAIASSQLFCYSEFVLFPGKDIYTLNSSDTIESFYNIRCNLTKLTYASHLLDIVNDVVQEEQPAYNTLKLLLNTLYKISREDDREELLIRVFEIRLMKILGFSPMVDGCIICNTKKLGEVHFSFGSCGFVCSSCLSETKDNIRLSAAAAQAITHIIKCDTASVFKFDIKGNTLKEISEFSEKYISQNLDKEYKKLDFLKGL